MITLPNENESMVRHTKTLVLSAEAANFIVLGLRDLAERTQNDASWEYEESSREQIIQENLHLANLLEAAPINEA